MGILGWGVLPGSTNPDPISDQTSKIHTHFQTWPSGRNYVIKYQQMHFEFTYFYIVLIHLELK